jgi:cytoskeletal protein CcmA (bactofilin family)
MTTISRSIRIHGELIGDDDLVVEGTVCGCINAPKNLIIAPEAYVQGDIRGRRVLVQGRVKGNVIASERIELEAVADLEGHLSANHVVIADGARFNGGIDMNRRTIAATVARYKEERPAAQRDEKARDIPVAARSGR